MAGYATLVRRPGFLSFVLAGAFAYAAPLVVNVVLAWSIAVAYPGVGAASSFVALALVLNGLSATVPTLASALFAGALADRARRRRLMLGANAVLIAAAAGLVLDLAVLPTTGIPFPGPAGFFLPTWLVLAFPLYAAVTVSTTIFRPAYNASIPKFAPKEELGRANALVYALAIAFGVAASVVATGLIPVAGFGPGVAIALALALGVGTQFALQLTPGTIDEAPTRRPTKFSSDVVEGYRYLARQPALLQLTLGSLAINFLTAMATVQLALYARAWLGVAPDQALLYGLLFGVATVGSGVGIFLISFIPFERRAGRVLLLLIVGQGITFALLGLVRSVPFALVDIFLFGLFPGMGQTVFLATVQARVPNELLGRVFAADEVGSYAFMPVGQAAGGYATLLTGAVQVTFLLSGVLTATTGGILSLSRSLRNLTMYPASAALPPEGAINPRPPEPRGA
ncbi:MAG TPA: MFS transporter [Thermoplasmata archaeon]|nr:MFS transporter [Thermoplasmata archaeon]